eukprot:3110642-Rhodomonas_salina.1
MRLTFRLFPTQSGQMLVGCYRLQTTRTKNVHVVYKDFVSLIVLISGIVLRLSRVPGTYVLRGRGSLWRKGQESPTLLGRVLILKPQGFKGAAMHYNVFQDENGFA